MNKNQELERIIKVNLPIGKEWSNNVAQAILDAGFIRLSDVELDEEKISKIIFGNKDDNEFIKDKGLLKLLKSNANKLAYAIAQAKGIVKVKEEE